MRLDTELILALTDFFRPIVAQCVQEAIQQINISPANLPIAEPYGDFNWLCSNCPGVPVSTLRIKSAAGEIPGVVKLGKRVLYEKAAVLSWLRSQTRPPIPDAVARERTAEEQISRRLAKKGSNST